MENYIPNSVGHSLALSLFFDGAATLATSSVIAVYNAANKKSSFRDDMYSAVFDTISATYYGLTPFFLRKMVKHSVVNSFGANCASLLLITSSSALIGAYKYVTKGKPAIIGALDNFLYSFIDFTELDSNISGMVLSCVFVETFTKCQSIKLEANPTTQKTISAFLSGGFEGVISGVAGYILLDKFGLYGAFTNPVMLSTALPHFAPCASVMIVACSLYSSNMLYNSQSLMASALPTLSVAVAYTLCTTTAVAPIITVGAAIVFMETNKAISLYGAKAAQEIQAP